MTAFKQLLNRVQLKRPATELNLFNKIKLKKLI